MHIAKPDKDSVHRAILAVLVLSAAPVITVISEGPTRTGIIAALLGCSMVCFGAVAYLFIRANIVAIWSRFKRGDVSGE